MKYCANFLFISISVPYMKLEQLKTFLQIFSLPSFMKMNIVHGVSNGVHGRFLCHVVWVHRTFQILVQFLDPESDHHVLLNFFGAVLFAAWNYFDWMVALRWLQYWYIILPPTKTFQLPFPRSLCLFLWCCNLISYCGDWLYTSQFEQKSEFTRIKIVKACVK